MRRSWVRRRWLGLLLLVAAVLWLAPDGLAAEPRDYAYLFLQGKLTDSGDGRPVANATVSVSADGQTHDAVSDRRGVFVFEKLPVQAYALRITTADGRVIHTAREVGLDELDRNRLEIQLGSGSGGALMVEASKESFAVRAPDPPPRWSRFWKQFLIFLGVAALLAL